jgi:hypothetical protein
MTKTKLRQIDPRVSNNLFGIQHEDCKIWVRAGSERNIPRLNSRMGFYGWKRSRYG